MIRFYQLAISPAIGPHCRFIPTCSAYALQCYREYNFFKATFLTITRLLRCNPLFKGGYDPVPKKK